MAPINRTDTSIRKPRKPLIISRGGKAIKQAKEFCMFKKARMMKVQRERGGLLNAISALPSNAPVHRPESLDASSDDSSESKRPKVFTQARKRKVRAFMLLFRCHPQKYGEFKSEEWFESLIEFLKVGKRKNSVVDAIDINIWMDRFPEYFQQTTYSGVPQLERQSTVGSTILAKSSNNALIRAPPMVRLLSSPEVGDPASKGAGYVSFDSSDSLFSEILPRPQDQYQSHIVPAQIDNIATWNPSDAMDFDDFLSFYNEQGNDSTLPEQSFQQQEQRLGASGSLQQESQGSSSINSTPCGLQQLQMPLITIPMYCQKQSIGDYEVTTTTTVKYRGLPSSSNPLASLDVPNNVASLPVPECPAIGAHLQKLDENVDPKTTYYVISSKDAENIINILRNAEKM